MRPMSGLFPVVALSNQVFKHPVPVRAIVGLQYMHSQGRGRRCVVRAIIYKNRLFRLRFFALEHHFEDAPFRLHDTHLVTEIKRIKVVVEPMPAAIEGAAACPLHHERIGVAQQAEPEAALAQLDEFVKVALWQVYLIALPAISAILKRQVLSCHFTQLATELLSGYLAALEIAEDAYLGKRIEVRCGIGKPHLVKTPDGLVLIYLKDNAT